MNLLDRIFNSLQWRLGLKHLSFLVETSLSSVDRLEDKLDYLLRLAVSNSAGDPDFRRDVITPGGLPVVFIADRNYFEPALVAISSLCRHAAPETSYRVFLILVGCGDREREIAEHAFPGITVISTKTPEIKYPVQSYVTVATMVRFDLPHLLPPDLDRVLYLDSDVVVRQDLAGLFKMDLAGIYLAAVRDYTVIYNRYPETIRHPRPNDYFNSGVLLLNLKKFREDAVAEKLYSCWRTNPEYVYPDQDCLNLVLGEQVRFLPSQYNTVINDLFVRLMRFDGCELTKITGESPEELQRAAKDPAIFHFAGGSKPWNTTHTCGCDWFLEEEWFYKRHCQRRRVECPDEIRKKP